MAGTYRVLLTEGAERDLEDIVDYIDEFHGPERAGHMLEELLSTAGQLASLPERGSHPRELLELGIKDYRQVFFKPYRLIYRVLKHDVILFMIADGRRDMPSLLSRRLLGG